MSLKEINESLEMAKGRMDSQSPDKDILSIIDVLDKIVKELAKLLPE